jgi:hypothetical protein
MKRDCVFLLADKNIRASFEGFFSRHGFHNSLGCDQINIDPSQDLIVAAGDNDPGIYTRAHELLRPFLTTHRRAVVVLDAEWEGSPGAVSIRSHIESMLQVNGWEADRCVVIVIDPELENWIWQRSIHVARQIGFDSTDEMYTDTDLRLAWPDEQYKPTNPKEALEAILRKKRIPRSSAIYRNITAQVSVSDCRDNAFIQLIEKLREWFPLDSDEVTL